MTTRKGEPTTPRIKRLLEDLKAELKLEYSTDFSFQVLGHGNVLASHNLGMGVIDPQTPPEPPLKGVRCPQCDKTEADPDYGHCLRLVLPFQPTLYYSFMQMEDGSWEPTPDLNDWDDQVGDNTPTFEYGKEYDVICNYCGHEWNQRVDEPK